MSRFTDDAVKLVNDVAHGKKLGEKSTHALVDLLFRMANKIEYLEKEIGSIRKQQPPITG